MATTRTVYVLRHTKSSWDDETLTDYDRPLAPRGLRDGKRLARYIAEANLRPDVVLCSSARRTQETLAQIAHSLGTPAVRMLDELYGADVADVLALVHHLDDSYTSVLIIGHNPCIAELAQTQEKFPTGALATLRWDAESWDDLRPGEAEVVSIVTPKELPD
ncbi:MAG TPA: histidine phosphatase family protein [Acidimicrobiales bacterium]|nr:histidine phosphatase family protein [Acidimicrobiales bacterium]